MFRIARVSQVAVLAALGSSFACSGSPGDVIPGESTHTSSNAIVGGSRASAYEESALVGMYQNGQLTAYCSSSVIAPKVVLTAGHCVDGFTSWTIKAPYANGHAQSANGSSGTTYDWNEHGATNVNPNHHDIGLIFLDTPITLGTYPQLSNSQLPDNSNVVNIGRINNGSLSQTDLFVSSPIPVVDGAQAGFPFDYSAQQVIESGDSGGPDEVPGSTPHIIVAVNSGAGSGEVLARVDLLYSWIQTQIASHGGGGGGNPPPPDAGGGNPPPPDSGGGGGADSGGGGGGADSGGGGGGGGDSGGGGGGGGQDDSGGAGGSGGDTDSGGANADNSSGTWPSAQAGGCSLGGANGGSSGGALALGVGLVLLGLTSRRKRPSA